MITDKKSSKLIHLARILDAKRGKVYLTLRQVAPQHYTWFREDSSGQETETAVTAASIEEAMQAAATFWSQDSFRTVICGFRYGLPERDEHGINALFHQMAASYNSMTGVYFDEEVGFNCIVHNASAEARELFKKLQAQSRL
jgi:hypothetical protein